MSGDITTTRWPDAKARIIEFLRAAPELQATKTGPVLVSWSIPKDEDFTRECIYFAQTLITSEVAAMRSGRKTRNEGVTFTVVIHTATPGRDAETADRRCADIYSVLESKLADDITLVGAEGDDAVRLSTIGILSATIESATAGPDPDIEGYSGKLVATIHVTARLN